MYLLYYMAEGIRTDWGPVYVRYHVTWALLLLNMAVHYYIAARRYPEDDEIPWRIDIIALIYKKDRKTLLDFRWFEDVTADD